MRVYPFDIRTVVRAKYAQHVGLIHFLVALFITVVAFDYFAQWTKNRTLAAAAYFNLLLAAVSTMQVVATGFAAWQWALEGQQLKGILLMHLVLGLHIECADLACLFGSTGVCGAIRWHPCRHTACLEAVAVLLVGLTAHLGVFLSGVNGPG